MDDAALLTGEREMAEGENAYRMIEARHSCRRGRVVGDAVTSVVEAGPVDGADDVGFASLPTRGDEEEHRDGQ